MKTPRRGISRRDALVSMAGIGGLAVAGNVSGQQPPQPMPIQAIPIKGKAGPDLEPLDTAMLGIMERHGIPGAGFALAKDGKLLLAKGYGWSNVTNASAAQPSTLFGLASLSKPITAVATLKLVEQGKLKLDDPVREILKDIKPPSDVTRIDPRLKEITVRQCLNHSGGWDRVVAGDPCNWEPMICRHYNIKPPLTAHQFLEFMVGQPLQFDPGTDQKYSNIGYIILGEVIARVSGQPYERFATENILKPMGIKRAGLHGFDGKYTPEEAVRCLAGTFIALPAMLLPMINAAGGWSASVVDMARFMCNLDGSLGEPVLGAKMRQEMLAPPTDPLKWDPLESTCRHASLSIL